jgi:phosphopentomutase
MARAFLIVMDSVGMRRRAGCGGEFSTTPRPIRAPIRWAISRRPARGAADRAQQGGRCDAEPGPAGAWARRSGWPRRRRRRGLAPRPKGFGARRPKCRAARTRPRALGARGRAGAMGLALFPRYQPAFPPDLVARGLRGWRGPRAFWAIAMPRACRSSTSWAPSICGPAGRSAIPRPTACSRSPRMRRPSAWSGLLKLCQDLAPRWLHAMRVGRVIARPFHRGRPGQFHPHPEPPRLCHRAPRADAPGLGAGGGRATHAIGKIGDIFSHRGIGSCTRASRCRSGRPSAGCGWGTEAEPGSLTFANFVEFDSLYGHRRDVAGYAAALEWFDGARAVSRGCAPAIWRSSPPITAMTRPGRHRPHPRTRAGSGLGLGRAPSGRSALPMSGLGRGASVPALSGRGEFL